MFSQLAWRLYCEKIRPGYDFEPVFVAHDRRDIVLPPVVVSSVGNHCRGARWQIGCWRCRQSPPCVSLVYNTLVAVTSHSNWDDILSEHASSPLRNIAMSILPLSTPRVQTLSGRCVMSVMGRRQKRMRRGSNHRWIEMGLGSIPGSEAVKYKR